MIPMIGTLTVGAMPLFGALAVALLLTFVATTSGVNAAGATSPTAAVIRGPSFDRLPKPRSMPLTREQQWCCLQGVIEANVRAARTAAFDHCAASRQLDAVEIGLSRIREELACIVSIPVRPASAITLARPGRHPAHARAA